MAMDRRQLILSGIGLGAGAAATTAGARPASARAASASQSISIFEFGLDPKTSSDQTAKLQSAIDNAANSGLPLFIPPGRYFAHGLKLKAGSQLIGVPGQSILSRKGGSALMTGEDIANVRLEGLVLDGSGMTSTAKAALLTFSKIAELHISGCSLSKCAGDGIRLQSSAACLTDNNFANIKRTGLIVSDSVKLEVLHNHFQDCGTNGIDISRSTPGYDGSIVSMNRIERIALGRKIPEQSGDGIRLRNAASVMISNNNIGQCAHSAIRVETSSNCQISGNSCDRLSGSAILVAGKYSGVLISNNLIDKAATGISLKALSGSGSTATVQGNHVLNLTKRQEIGGIGIFIEAEAIVTGNKIDTADFVGLLLGWGRNLGNVSANANFISNAHIGIGISADSEAGYVAVMNNMITGSREGAIRAMDRGKPLGPDLSRQSAESYRNMAIFTNIGL